jgi:hypothetical protein
MNSAVYGGRIPSAMALMAILCALLAPASCGGNTTTEPSPDVGGGFVYDENGKIAVCHYQQDIGPGRW